uniref:ATP synthase complex subunit 8 n=1 Tax=Drepanepteryx phalaenoides TaxID=560898 RepID=A0A1S5QYP2_9NEOP|nr:ATP synthase F0 subunit 8 [Drepanepteryx phalaenoides]
MPQMSPLSWSILFIYFIFLLILFCIMNYYMIFYKTSHFFSKKFKSFSLNWKW